jgi:hypothetical protein
MLALFRQGLGRQRICCDSFEPEMNVIGTAGNLSARAH